MLLRSWVHSANDPQTSFPIQNLPYGVFGRGERTAIGVAIGDQILDLRACAELGLLAHELAPACAENTLNSLMAVGRTRWSMLRRSITEILASGSVHQKQAEPLLVSSKDANMRLPVAVGDYTDFFASLHHATNTGSLFRPGNPLFPNYKSVPIGYHGRASSIVVSGTPIPRPSGQSEDKVTGKISFAPSRALDYELEIGTFVGPGNRLGEPISIKEAPDHIFGLCLLNDWSARDIQSWESQPLGPFLSKSFATSISPWIVPMEALQPFRVPAGARGEGDPALLPYLYSKDDQERGGLDIVLEVHLASRWMRDAGQVPVRLSRGNFRDLYWTIAQLLTHHTSNGCNLRPGDLFGSGTISGPAPASGPASGSGPASDSRGCLLEITRRGQEPMTLPNGEVRAFLEDGDEVILRAFCEREGEIRIGFGECRGVVQLPGMRH